MDEFPERSESEKTHTIGTEFGAVEFETVTCASCGSETPKQSAQPFFIGPVQRTHSNNVKYEVDFESREETAVGWACPYCREEGPMRYPQIDRVAAFFGQLPQGDFISDWLRGEGEWRFARSALIAYGVVVISAILFTLILFGVLGA